MNFTEETGPIPVEDCDGSVVVYKRLKNRTRFYYASIKLPHNGKWKKISLKTDDLKEAKKKAKNEFETIKIKLANNIPIDTRSFRAVAEAGIQTLEELLRSGRGKVSYQDYINCLRRFKDFFGLKPIASFKYQDLIELDNFRNSELGRKAAKSTINTHNAALNWLFNFALKNGWIHQSQVPELENHGRAGVRRPAFNEDEILILKDSILINPPVTKAGWKTPVKLNSSPVTPKRKLTQEIHELLHDYVMILLNTGLRPGRELLEMKWCHLSEFVEGKGNAQVKYLEMQVIHGKTGQRKVIAGTTTRVYFENIQKRFEHLKNLPFDRLTKIDEYIFRLPDGTRPKDLHGAFNRVLERSGLKLDPRTQTKRTLYSLRHTYATHMLVKHSNIHLIAKNMGTSIEMLERHYSHAEVRRGAKHLAQTDFQVKSSFSGAPALQAQLKAKQKKDPLNIDPGF